MNQQIEKADGPTIEADDTVRALISEGLGLLKTKRRATSEKIVIERLQSELKTAGNLQFITVEQT